MNWETIGSIGWPLLTAVLGSLATIAFKFDINEYLKHRERKQENKLQNLCPHIIMLERGDEKLRVESLYAPVMGQMYWACRQCNHQSDSRGVELNIEYWKQRPHEYKAQAEKFTKLIKKMGLA